MTAEICQVQFESKCQISRKGTLNGNSSDGDLHNKEENTLILTDRMINEANK